MSKRTTVQEVTTVEEVAAGELNLDQTLLATPVKYLPLPPFMQNLTTAENVGQFLGWAKKGEVFVAFKINRLPVTKASRPIEFTNPNERKSAIFAALDICLGIYKLITPTVHTFNIDENMAYIANAMLKLDTRSNKWVPFDWMGKAIRYAQVGHYMSQEFIWKQWALSTIVSGQYIRIGMEDDKENLVSYVHAVMNATLADALENREERINAAREAKQIFNAAKKSDEMPTSIKMSLDGIEIDLFNLPEGTKVTMLESNGKFVKNTTWRTVNRDNKVKMFASYAKRGCKLETGWRENEAPEEEAEQE